MQFSANVIHAYFNYPFKKDVIMLCDLIDITNGVTEAKVYLIDKVWVDFFAELTLSCCCFVWGIQDWDAHICVDKVWVLVCVSLICELISYGYVTIASRLAVTFHGNIICQPP